MQKNEENMQLSALVLKTKKILEATGAAQRSYNEQGFGTLFGTLSYMFKTDKLK